MAACKSCGAVIVFRRTVRGNAMPVDPEPMAVVLDQAGHLKVVLADGAVATARRSFDDREARVPGWTSHFATCPNAASHRKRGP